MKNPLEALKRRLDAIPDAEPVIVTAIAGSYYDGTETEHGETYPELIIAKTDATRRAINSISKHYHVIWNGDPYHYTITTQADHERARAAADIADAFLTAFWTYIHNHGHNPAAQAAALEAGRAAVIRATAKEA